MPSSYHWVSIYGVFLWSVFSPIWAENEDLLPKSPYSVQIQENTDQKKLSVWKLFMQCPSSKFMFKLCWMSGWICSKLLERNHNNIVFDVVKVLLFLILNTFSSTLIPVGIHLFKFNNGNTTICGICSELTIKTLQRHHWGLSGVSIVNFEQISHNVTVFL